MTDLRAAAQQALEAMLNFPDDISDKMFESIVALRAALAQKDESQTIDDALTPVRAMAQAYEAGYKAGAAAERKRIIQFLTEMQRQVGDGHNYYGVAAMRIRERV